MPIIVSKEDQKQAKRRNSIGEGIISQNKEKSRKRRLSIENGTVLGESRKRAAVEEKTIGQGISYINPALQEGETNIIVMDGDKSETEKTLPQVPGVDMEKIMAFIASEIRGPIQNDMKTFSNDIKEIKDTANSTGLGVKNIETKVDANTQTIQTVRDSLKDFVTKDDMKKANLVTRQEMEDAINNIGSRGNSRISYESEEQENRIYMDSIKASSTKFLISGLDFNNKTDMKAKTRALIADTLKKYWGTTKYNTPSIKDIYELKRDGMPSRIQVEFQGNYAAKDRSMFLKATSRCPNKDIIFSKDLSPYYRDKHWEFGRMIQAMKADDKTGNLEAYIDYNGPYMRLRTRETKDHNWGNCKQYRPPTTDKTYYKKNVANKGVSSDFAEMQDRLDRTVTIPLKRVQKEIVEEKLRTLLSVDEYNSLEITTTKNHMLKIVAPLRAIAEDLQNRVNGKKVDDFTFTASIFERMERRPTYAEATAISSEGMEH